MSNESAEKRQAFERWVSSLRAGGSQVVDGEESGVSSLDEQKTLVQRLPKDLVRQLREREAGRLLDLDQENTAIFQPPPELLARAKRLVPPKKPERSAAPSTPEEPLPQFRPTPVVAAPLPDEAVMPPELPHAPLPTLADAVDWEEPPVMLTPRAPTAPPVVPTLPSRRTAWFAWTAVVVSSALLVAFVWFALTRTSVFGF